MIKNRYAFFVEVLYLSLKTDLAQSIVKYVYASPLPC